MVVSFICIKLTKRISKYKFLEEVPTNSVIYFHNLGYDSKMFGSFDTVQSVDKGTRTIMTQLIKFHSKTIILKDSLSILPFMS